jgi:hypothetical protein
MTMADDHRVKGDVGMGCGCEERERGERSKERERGTDEKRCFWAWDDDCFVVCVFCVFCHCTRLFFGLLSFFAGRLACAQRASLRATRAWHAVDL